MPPADLRPRVPSPASAPSDSAPDPTPRITTLTLVATCAGVLAALWVADRAMATALGELPAPAASPAAATAARLRGASWLLGLAALGAATFGLVHERRVRRRAADRAAQLERLSGELMRANRAKSEFLANVSHELRTPLNAVVGFAELMQDGVYGELTPSQAAPVRRIAASATHLRQLVDQILDLARIAAGRLEVHAEAVALRPFVLDVAGEVESLVREKGLALSIAVPAALPRLRSDPLHVRQVLVNLLGNAVKFTPSGGRIGVRGALVDAAHGAPPFAPAAAGAVRPPTGLERLLRPRGRGGDAARAETVAAGGVPWIALQVSDTGVGIAPADQARIFDEFEQLGSRTGDSAERGTGLGLAISRRLAQLLGGELTLESALGAGSTFTLWLPVDPIDVATTDAAITGGGSAARPPAAGERRREETRVGGRRRGDRPGPAPEVAV